MSTQTVHVRCVSCGREDVLTAEPVPGRTIPQLFGWQVRVDVHVCGKCAGTDETFNAPLLTLGSALDS